jgi:hypothetical protein
LLAEAAWLCQDIRQERLWKKKMAFMFAHQIANSNIKLKPVAAGNRASTGMDVSLQSTRRQPRQKCVLSSGGLSAIFSGAHG